VQVLWTFSIYLEAVAIIPQLAMCLKLQQVDSMVWSFIVLRG
jgi:hypothetical protein